MAVCTCFGHVDAPETVKPKIEEVFRNLIAEENVTQFYIGNNGSLDRMAYGVLKKLEQEYPYISFAVVLTRVPGKTMPYDAEETMLPEGIEKVLPRFTIPWRNKWMIEHSDFVVTYVTHSWGGAWQASELAKRKGKMIIALA